MASASRFVVAHDLRTTLVFFVSVLVISFDPHLEASALPGRPYCLVRLPGTVVQAGLYLAVVYLFVFYAPQLVPPGTAEARISYGICLSVRPSVRLSRPGTDSMPDEIETPGLHRMIAWSI